MRKSRDLRKRIFLTMKYVIICQKCVGLQSPGNLYEYRLDQCQTDPNAPFIMQFRFESTISLAQILSIFLEFIQKFGEE